MSLPKYAAKRDISEPGIIRALTQCGCYVYKMNKPVDLLVSFKGKAYLVECKTRRKDGGFDKLTPAQRLFIDEWTGPPVVQLHSAEEAVIWCNKLTREEAT